MPRTRKPAGTAVDPRNGRRAELEPAAATPPRAPVIDRSSFRPTTLKLWDAYWEDVAATTQSPADLFWALVWLESMDDYWRLKEVADREPMSEGSMGQMIANPLYAVAKDALMAAERAARQLGVGAKNRADLGVAILQERVTLDGINAKYLTPEYTTTDGPDSDADDDPRGPAGS